MKTMKINLGKLNRAYEFFNELNEKANNDNVLVAGDVNALRVKHRVSSNAFKSAVTIGYFSKVKHGRYKSNFGLKFDPKHIREILEKEKELYPKVLGTDKKEPTMIKVKKKRAKRGTYKPRKASVVKVEEKYTGHVMNPTQPMIAQNKTFSIFWGLIKFNY